MSSNTTELSLVDKLRMENEDQFFTLVRMHLSFVLDLNTDETDTNEKSKYFKWNFTKKSFKVQGQTQTPMISAIKSNPDTSQLTGDGASKMYEIMEFLGEIDNVCQEGIFRRTGSLSRQQELKQLIANGAELNLYDGRFSVHDCASVLKGFLAELPEPLLQEQHYQAYCQLSAQCLKGGDGSLERVLTGVQLLVLQLNNQAKHLLKRLLGLLAAAAKAPTSRMSAETLATLFTPHLLCPRRLSPEALHADSSNLAPVLSFMISHYDRVFDIPTKLATDIVAYLTIREKRRMLSPNGELNESVSDRTAANTVFTFVDRDRTAVENEANPTDTALAQLYAHIQALPDSQHKRRLVKQFNKENGYGTPRQLQRYQKLKPKTLGDSIKKHIFHKGILNKQTPKKYPELNSDCQAISETTSISEKDRKQINHHDAIPNPSLASDLISTQLNMRAASAEVSHRNIVIKNMVNQISKDQTNLIEASSDSDTESDCSSTSIHSESGILDSATKLSPKFSSEPNLSTIECNEITPKIANKKVTKLFRSKVISTERKPNICQKRPTQLTPKFKPQDALSKTNHDYSPLNIYKTCMKCTDTVDSCSDVDESFKDNSQKSTPDKIESDTHVCLEHATHLTPRLSRKDSLKCMRSKKFTKLISDDLPSNSHNHFGITSTPNINLKTAKLQCLPGTPGTCADEDRPAYSTPYYAPSVRRSSMSPITKSTQKMSKAMQESIMTPRSRKPVVVLSTCDQRDMSLFSDSVNKEQTPSSSDSTFDSYSPKNDSDFVSTDESNSESNRNNQSAQVSASADGEELSKIPYTKFSNSQLSDREQNLRIIHERSLTGSICSDGSCTSLLKSRLNCESVGRALISEVGLPELATPGLSEPFRKYLLTRSVLTATPVDLSFTSLSEDFNESYANKVGNLPEKKMSESLLCCLNGNDPREFSVQAARNKQSNEVIDSTKCDSATANTSCSEQTVRLKDITNTVLQTTVKEKNFESAVELLDSGKLSNKTSRKRSSFRISSDENDSQESEIENKKVITDPPSISLLASNETNL